MTDSTVAQSTIHRVAVVGSGYMGGGIAQVLALSGATVVLADIDGERAAAALNRLIEQADRFEASGLFDAGSGEVLRQRLTAANSVEDAVASADYVTEAVFETRETKRDALTRISAAAPAQAIIATNTSAIPIGELAEAVERPERFLGVHWMNPAPFIPGVELIAATQTSAHTIETVETFIRAAGKVTARVADSPGFVANRLQFALYREAVKVVEEGLATPAEIDLVVSSTFGFRLALFGPFAIGDMAGLDVYAAAYATLAASLGDRLDAPASLTRLVDEGHLGLKSGKGFLDIDEADVPQLLSYREKAYHALSSLRRQLGPPPGL
ncbi:3-hydroxyacyl-CoA dehydrogenase family protein [soil metagenome]